MNSALPPIALTNNSDVERPGQILGPSKVGRQADVFLRLAMETESELRAMPDDEFLLEYIALKSLVEGTPSSTGYHLLHEIYQQHQAAIGMPDDVWRTAWDAGRGGSSD